MQLARGRRQKNSIETCKLVIVNKSEDQELCTVANRLDAHATELCNLHGSLTRYEKNKTSTAMAEVHPPIAYFQKILNRHDQQLAGDLLILKVSSKHFKPTTLLLFPLFGPLT